MALYFKFHLHKTRRTIVDNNEDTCISYTAAAHE